LTVTTIAFYRAVVSYLERIHSYIRHKGMNFYSKKHFIDKLSTLFMIASILVIMTYKIN